MSQTVTGSAGSIALTDSVTTTAPVDGEAANAASQVTLVQALANWIDALKTKLKAIYDGSKTLKSVQVDGTGQNNATAASGSVTASGDIIGGGKIEQDISGTPATYYLTGTVQTINGSTTAAITFTVPTNKAIVVSGQIIGYKSDFTNAISVHFRNFGAKDAGGTLTQFSAGTTDTTKDDATWGSPGPAVTANLFVVYVTGKAATTINWKAMAKITII